jgi:hypothetical protein
MTKRYGTTEVKAGVDKRGYNSSVRTNGGLLSLPGWRRMGNGVYPVNPVDPVSSFLDGMYRIDGINTLRLELPLLFTEM